MGAWGTAVFSDDLACDARDGFRELIGEGYTAEDATAKLVAEFGGVDCPDVGVQWIALAVTQWNTGRLLDSVRERAVQAIADETGERWASSADWAKRQKVLAQTVTMLNSPQRSVVSIKRAVLPESPFAAGDVLRFTMGSGLEAAVWVLTRIERSTLTRASIETPLVLLAFGDPKLGPVDELVSRRPVVATMASGWSLFVQFSMLFPQDARPPRWTVLGNAPVPTVRQDPRGFTSPLMLRKGPGGRDERADAFFAGWYEAAQRTPSPLSSAQLELAEHFPEIPHLWDGRLSAVPFEVAQEIAERVPSADIEHARLALELADDQLDGPAAVRQCALELIDRLLCIASHPETALTRDQVLGLLGRNATELVPRIDSAWNAVGGTSRWGRLDQGDQNARRRAYANCRCLEDGSYAINGFYAWSGQDSGGSSDPAAPERAQDRGSVMRGSPAAYL